MPHSGSCWPEEKQGTCWTSGPPRPGSGRRPWESVVRHAQSTGNKTGITAFILPASESRAARMFSAGGRHRLTPVALAHAADGSSAGTVPEVTCAEVQQAKMSTSLSFSCGSGWDAARKANQSSVLNQRCLLRGATHRAVGGGAPGAPAAPHRGTRPVDSAGSPRSAPVSSA